MDGDGLMRIGEVADLTHLSLRRIRHYEDMGVVVPSARTKGGFRLYTGADVDRLRLARRMKPLDLTLEQVRDLLDHLDALASLGTGEPTTEEDLLDRRTVVDRVRMYLEVAEHREDALVEQTALVQGLATELRERISTAAGLLAESKVTNDRPRRDGA